MRKNTTLFFLCLYHFTRYEMQGAPLCKEHTLGDVSILLSERVCVWSCDIYFMCYYAKSPSKIIKKFISHFSHHELSQKTFSFGFSHRNYSTEYISMNVFSKFSKKTVQFKADVQSFSKEYNCM